MRDQSFRAVVLFLVLALCAMPAMGQDGGASSHPRILVHYMPWYQAKPFAPNWGWHWTMDHFNPDVLDMDDRRQIASHSYPLIGPYDSRDEDVIEYHALLMKVAGIDGVIVDWYGTSGLFDYPEIHEATLRTFSGISAAGLSFAICYEDQTVQHLIDRGALTAGQAVAHAQEQIEFVRDAWISHSSYLRLDGAPVILNFGPQYFKSAAQWEQILSVLDEPAAFFTLDQRLDPVAAGAFAWPPMHIANGRTLSRGELDRYLNLFYAHGRLEWPSFVGGAFPGFHDIYAEAGVGSSYGFLDARGGQTFSSTLERALDENSPIIQIATWNDFGEGTNIEPTREYGYQYLMRIQEAVADLKDLPFPMLADTKRELSTALGVLIGAALCVAITCAADMMADLKTGYIVGAIPKKQQIVELIFTGIGPLISMLVLLLIVQANMEKFGIPIGVGTDTTAPQAQALQAVIHGIRGESMPYMLYGLGALAGALLGLGSFAGLGVLIGLSMYLPMNYIATYGIGCIISIIVAKVKGRTFAEEWGVPLAAGFIVGDALLGLSVNLVVLMQS